MPQIIYENFKASNHVFSGSSDDSTELQKKSVTKIDYIIAPPRMARYMEYSTKIYNIYLKYIAPGRYSHLFD